MSNKMLYIIFHIIFHLPSSNPYHSLRARSSVLDPEQIPDRDMKPVPCYKPMWKYYTLLDMNFWSNTIILSGCYYQDIWITLTYLCNRFVCNTHFNMFLDGFIWVLRMMHSDTCRNSFHIRPLLLVPDFVNGIQKPRLPCGSCFFFGHFCFIIFDIHL